MTESLSADQNLLTEAETLLLTELGLAKVFIRQDDGKLQT